MGRPWRFDRRGRRLFPVQPVGPVAPQRRERVLVLLQAVAVLVATWCLRNGGPAVLLIIVAAQVVAMWPRWQAIAIMAVINGLLLAIWLQGTGWTSAVLALLPMIGFQTFAALTVHYATNAEQARRATGAHPCAVAGDTAPARGQRAQRRASAPVARVARCGRPQAHRAQAQPASARARSGAGGARGSARLRRRLPTSCCRTFARSSASCASTMGSTCRQRSPR